MKAVMYHYVRPNTNAPPDYYYLHLEDFRRQLSYFEEEYGFVGRECFQDVIRGKAPVPDQGVVLTFDDGLVDHYRWVLPELRERGLWGIFYVPTAPLMQNRFLDVHWIHLILGTCDVKRVDTELKDLVEEKMVPPERRDEFQAKTYTRQENKDVTTRVKRILNYFIAPEYRESVFSALANRLPEIRIAPENLYMSAKQLRELEKAGMIIGSHTVTHRLLSSLEQAEQRFELMESFKHLSMLLEGEPQTFCYPYGGEHSFTPTTVDLLEEIGCDCSFSVESRDVTTEDVRKRIQELPRYDCNEFQHGGASGGV